MHYPYAKKRPFWGAFWSGVASVFEAMAVMFGGAMPRHYRLSGLRGGFQRDREKIAGDWRRVGSYVRSAIPAISEERAVPRSPTTKKEEFTMQGKIRPFPKETLSKRKGRSQPRGTLAVVHAEKRAESRVVRATRRKKGPRNGSRK